MSQELRKHKEKELEQCELMLKVSLAKFNVSSLSFFYPYHFFDFYRRGAKTKI